MDVPGVDVRPLRQMNGDAHFSEVFLDDAPVDDADRIAPVGEGWRVARTALAHERGAIGGRQRLRDAGWAAARARPGARSR
jgi:alkylation response protein AidB-like acyl-CoA dehydrogenase